MVCFDGTDVMAHLLSSDRDLHAHAATGLAATSLPQGPVALDPAPLHQTPFPEVTHSLLRNYFLEPKQTFPRRQTETS